LSWAATEHVDEGREAVNYSEFATGGDHEAEDTIEVIREGSMPPFYYTLFGLHPDADLSRDEIDELISGLRATPGLTEDEHEDEDEEQEEDEDHDADEDSAGPSTTPTGPATTAAAAAGSMPLSFRASWSSRTSMTVRPVKRSTICVTFSE